MTADAAPAPDSQPKAKIFISYSRKDVAFVDRLEAALKTRGFEALIDRTEIYAFEDWWQRIQALIGRADTIAFVLSPDAVTSDTALKEVAHGAALNKRFAPIVARRVEDAAVPEPLRRLNFIFFDDPDRFEASADQLAKALTTDIAWIRQHTELGETARRWLAARRPNGLLLRSPVLDEAERWIASRPPGAPAPTEETQAFIRQSRQATTRRRNVLTGSLAAGLLLALGLAGLAYWQRGVAVEQEKIAQEQRGAAEEQQRIAEEQRSIAERRRIATLSELATSERLRGNWDTALKLSAYAAALTLRFDQSRHDMSAPGAVLATTIWQSDWRLMLSGHDHSVNFAALSPDGKRVVTASDDKTARIWDAATGKPIRVLRGHKEPVSTATFSPDGARIVTASDDDTARVWDATNGKQIAVLSGHTERVTFASFSPDGTRILTASDDNTARIWDVATGRQVAVLQGPTEGSLKTTAKVFYPTSASFSPDGTRIVTALWDRTARIWDAATGKEIGVLGGHEEAVVSASFSPDGTRIVTVSNKQAPPPTTCGSSCEYLATPSSVLRIWDAASGKQIKILPGRAGSYVNFAAFSPDGHYVITASADKTARVWDVETATEIAVLRGHEAAVRSAIFTPDGKHIVTASNDKTARIWDVPTVNKSVILRNEAQLLSAAFSPDGKLVITTGDEEVARIWNSETAQQIAALRGHELGVESGSFSPDGTRAVTASLDGTIRIWDVAAGGQVGELGGHEGAVRHAEYSPDGMRLVTASDDETARVWDAGTGREIAVLEAGGNAGDGAIFATFSPDGTRIVTTSDDLRGSDNLVRIWNSATAKQIAALRGHERQVHSASFSPDGSRIVTASWDHTARIWNAVSGKLLTVLRGHDDAVNSAAFSPDGRRILTASNDATVRIWDAESGKQIATLSGHSASVFSAAFDRDGTRIVTASADKTARIWDVHFATASTAVLLTEVCTRRLRGLTKLNRDEMRLAGYPDDTPEFDVCAGIQ